MASSEPAGLSVVKLGGAVITRKRGAAAVRGKVLDRLGEELATATGPLIVLHGAGSFGHPEARRFGLAGAPSGSPRERVRGASIVRAEVRTLHRRVLRALVDAGLRPWSIDGSAVVRQREQVVTSFDPEPFARALAGGFVPVSFGDVALDDAWGVSIVSADALARELARTLRPRRVVFVSDVPGVLVDRSGGRPKIHERLDRSLLDGLAPTGAGPDVTGGIRGKVAAMLAIAEGGVDAGLISGLSDGALSRAVRGESVYGSWARGASA